MKIRQYEVDKDSCSDNARGFLNTIKRRDAYIEQEILEMNLICGFD